MYSESCDILILSANYGGGHNQVARALTQALQTQAPGIKISTVDYNELLFPLLNRLTQFGYSQSIRHFPVGYALYYQATGNIAPDSFWQKSLNRMGYTELILLVNRLRPKVVISTFPLPSGVLSKMKSAGVLNIPVVTVITDISVHSQWIHPYTDLYLVGSQEVATGLIDRGINPAQIVVTGIPILADFSQSYDRRAVRQHLGLKTDSKVILFMGGSIGIFGTTNFSYLLGKIETAVEAVVVTGSNDELYEKLTQSSHSGSKLKVYRYIENIAGIMETADLLVTKAGGITISEALAKGLPMVVYKPTPGQESANACFLRSHRAALVTKGERQLRSAIERIATDDAFRNQLRRNCLKLAKPDSAVHCARLILKMMQPGGAAFYFSKEMRREMRVGNTP